MFVCFGFSNNKVKTLPIWIMLIKRLSFGYISSLKHLALCSSSFLLDCTRLSDLTMSSSDYCWRSLLACALFLIFCASLVEGNVHYYIVPSLNATCPHDPCLTLSLFAVNSSSYIGSHVDLSLSILPAYHSLKFELYLTHLDN